MKIISVVGARPNFMKIAPIARAIKKERRIQNILVHTGQHYDFNMSNSFFKDLGIPRPDVNLKVGSDTHARQTADIMVGFEKILLKERPSLVMVVGDVNSTLACSLVATKLHVPVAHVEAGLRSFDRSMPEEINRLVTDSVSEILFTTCKDADINLRKEGKPADQIFFVGNVMIDNLFWNLPKAKKSQALIDLGLSRKDFGLITLHRPSNVDSTKSLKKFIGALHKLQKEIPMVFPMHPRTREHFYRIFPKKSISKMKNLIITNPLGYHDFLSLMMNAKFVITDSGGIQEETTVLGIPCLTARKNTERPITITQGTNTLVGVDPQKIFKESRKIIRGKSKSGKKPKCWDGKSAQRIVKIIKRLRKQGKI